MKNKTKYKTVGTFPKSNTKVVERGKIYTPHTQRHDRSRSCLCTGTMIESSGVRLLLWSLTLREKRRFVILVLTILLFIELKSHHFN